MKIDGIYYGKLHDTIKSIRTEDMAEPFIEVLPISSGYLPLTVVIDSEFLLSPPDNTIVTHLDGGELIKFTEVRAGYPFRLLNQKKDYNYVATVYYDNTLKLSIETNSDFFIKECKLNADKGQIQQINIGGKSLLAITLYGQSTYLYIYDIANNITEIFSSEVTDVNFDNGLSTSYSFNDIAKHKITANWKYENNTLLQSDSKIERDKDFDYRELNEKIIPYAFLEELSLNGDVKEYLSDELTDESEKLKGYFGEFTGIMPPPTFKDYSDVGVIYKVKDNVYRVEYYTFELDNKKISNIKRSAE